MLAGKPRLSSVARAVFDGRAQRPCQCEPGGHALVIAGPMPASGAPGVPTTAGRPLDPLDPRAREVGSGCGQGLQVRPRAAACLTMPENLLLDIY